VSHRASYSVYFVVWSKLSRKIFKGLSRVRTDELLILDENMKSTGVNV